jgi:hypothetical protein
MTTQSSGPKVTLDSGHVERCLKLRVARDEKSIAFLHERCQLTGLRHISHERIAHVGKQPVLRDLELRFVQNTSPVVFRVDSTISVRTFKYPSYPGCPNPLKFT